MSLETDRIEADLNASRHRLNDTIEALGSKISPGQMLDEALGLLQGQAGTFAGKLGRQVRDNPMPTLLIASGIAWLALSSRQSGHHAIDADDWRHEQRYRSVEEARWSVQRLANETEEAFNDRLHAAHAAALDLKQKAGEAAHEFKARVGNTVEDLKTRAASARDRVRQAVSDARDYGAHQAQRVGQAASDARHKAEDMYTETPLAAGAIALAIGALVGGATPLTRQERDVLEGVADKAARAGANLAEKGARAVDESLDRSLH